MGSPAGDFGVFLWIVLTSLPIAAALHQFFSFRAKKRYTLQPVYASNYSPNINPLHIRYACVAFQFLLFVLLLLAVSLNMWSYVHDADGEFGGSDLGLVNYYFNSNLISPTAEYKQMVCSIDYVGPKYTVSYNIYNNYSQAVPQSYSVYPIMNIDGTICFSLVGSSVVVFIFALVSFVLSLYQLSVLQPWIKWNYFIELRPGQELAAAMSGGLWVRTSLFVILQMVMTFMYGVLACGIGGARPGVSFFILLALTIVSPLQLFLVARFIQSHQPPHVKVPPALELMGPSDVAMTYAAAEETVASAVALVAAATATLERLNISIHLKESQAAEAASAAVPPGSLNNQLLINQDLSSLAAASAMIRAASEAASAAAVAARAGVAAIKPMMFEQEVAAAAKKDEHVGNGANPSPIQPVAGAGPVPAPPIPPRLRSPSSMRLIHQQSNPPVAAAIAAPAPSSSSQQIPLRHLLPVSSPIELPNSYQSPSRRRHISNNVVNGMSSDREEGKEEGEDANVVDPYQIQPRFDNAMEQGEEAAPLTYSQELEHLPPVNVRLDPDEASSVLLSLSAAGPQPFIPHGLSPVVPLDSSIVLNVDGDAGNYDDGTADNPVAPVDAVNLPSPSGNS